MTPSECQRCAHAPPLPAHLEHRAPASRCAHFPLPVRLGRAVHLIKGGGEQHAPEYAAINEQELVPTLDIDGHKLTQSLAIIEYLEATRPDANVIPKDPVLAAQARRVAMNIACDTQPIQNLRVLQHVEKETGSPDKKAAWANHWITKGLAGVEAAIKGSAGTCCVGDEVTIADICLVPQVRRRRVARTAWRRVH